MKLDFFVISLFPGLCTLCSCLSRQYHFVNITMNWTEAQSYCRQNYTDLATIDSTEEVKALTEAVGSGYDGKAWIGLQRAGSDGWQWSLTDRGFYSEGEAEFRDWENGQPNNRVGTEDCVAVERNGKWHDFSCQDNIFFICYDRQNVSQRYFLIEQEKTWTEAQRYCREKHTDLVSVRNQAENQEVLSTIQTSAWVWIGLFNDPWKWSDQSSSSFRYWNTGEPNNNGGREECVEMWFGHSGRWNDEYCENKRAFICYQGVRRLVVRLKLTTTTTLNMRDPAVSEAMLQQIERKLKTQSLPEDSKLWWREQPDGEIFLEEEYGREGD